MEMTINGRAITEKDMDSIVIYMDDEIREAVHMEFAPCSPEIFLEEYLKRDPEFEDLLIGEFDFRKGV